MGRKHNDNYRLLASNTKAHTMYFHDLPLTSAPVYTEMNCQPDKLTQETNIICIIHWHNRQSYQVSEWSSRWSGPFRWILHIIYGKKPATQFSHSWEVQCQWNECLITVTFKAPGLLKENHGRREKGNTFSLGLLTPWVPCMLECHYSMKMIP